MDPISQGALGAVIPQSIASTERVRSYALLGCLSGMAPDLDFLLRSSSDPLLFLEYHRQFTHALVFVPIGAAICAALLFVTVRSRLNLKDTYVACILGYGSHGLLDACTSYGTQLLWPFTDYRVDWNNVSIVDPAFTIPLLLLGLASFIWRRGWIAALGLFWAIAYLTAGFVQHQRVIETARELVHQRGHTPVRIDAKPGFANLIMWKVIYEHDGRYYVDAIRASSAPTVCEGESIEKLDSVKQYPWMHISSQQNKDIERFRWFSDDFLAVDPSDPLLIIDVRYSALPNRIDGLWGIRIDPDGSDEVHAAYETNRTDRADQLPRLINMVLGESC